LRWRWSRRRAYKTTPGQYSARVLDPDRIAEAVAGLDPQQRAMLELSARRGLGDDEIADVLQVDSTEVGRRREEALDLLAARLGLTEEQRPGLGRELEGLSEEHWRATPAATGGSPRRVLRVVAVTVLVTAAVIVGLVLALSGSGGGDEEASRPEPTAAKATPEPAPETAPQAAPRPARVVTMQRLNGTNGRGTAQIVRSGGTSRLRLEVDSFLRPNGGGYAVWLHSPGRTAHRLFATTQTAFEREFPLPKDLTRFEFAEVARAVPALDSDHSGLTLLRVPLSRLQ
jgi:hypothetical protein